jgi:hypothetical protein
VLVRTSFLYRNHVNLTKCRPILTYGHQATKKRGLKPQDHAIIYTDGKSKTKQKDSEADPISPPKEIEGEQKLRKKPIRVVPRTPRDHLDPLSRLNYTKIYTIEYNVKVCFVGTVHKESLNHLKRDYNITHPPLPEELDVEFSDQGEDVGCSSRTTLKQHSVTELSEVEQYVEAGSNLSPYGYAYT